MTETKELNCINEDLLNGTIYETVTGSKAFMIDNSNSDTDVIGIYIPPRQYMYPQEFGYIQGYSHPSPEMPKTKQVHQVFDKNGQEYDINLFHISHFFKLAKAGNPNIMDMLNVHPSFHRKMHAAGKRIIDNRHLFFSKDMYHPFKGMMLNHKETLLKRQTGHNHKDLIDKFGYDTKDAGHCIRTAGAFLDILRKQEYEPHTYHFCIQNIREGLYTLNEVIDMFNECVQEIENLMKTTKLREHVDEKAIHNLFALCLEDFYGKNQ